jgi:hypothetical protein
MKMQLLYALAVIFFASVTARAEEKGETPLHKAKVGDFLVYKVTSKSGEESLTYEGTARHVLTAKTDKQARLEITRNLGAKSAMTFKFGLQLSEANDALYFSLFRPASLGLELKEGDEVTENLGKKIGEGKEKVSLGDKNYDCTWLTFRKGSESRHQKVESEIKVWLCPTVPLTGIVKMEVKDARSSKGNPSKGTKLSTVIELMESGNQK